MLEINLIYAEQLDNDFLKKIAKNLISEDIELDRFLRIELCDSKYAVINLIKICEYIGYPRNECGISFLFGCLQDANWPFFDEALSALEKLPRQLLLNRLEKILEQAYQEKDFMWISGLKILSDRIEITKEEFVNKSTYDLFSYRDF